MVNGLNNTKNPEMLSISLSCSLQVRCNMMQHIQAILPFCLFFTSLLASRMVKCQTRRLTPHCCVASGARIDDGCGFQGAPFKLQFLELTADL